MAVARFWRKQDQRYNLTGSKCPICEKVFFPSKPMCPTCHRKSLGNMEPFNFSGRGKIESYTVIHAGMPQFKSQVPYIMAYIALEEGDHILGQIVDCDPEDVEIDSKVEMVFRRLGQEGKSGTIHYGYKFSLVIEND